MAASACGSSDLAGPGAPPPGPGVQAAEAKEEEEDEEDEEEDKEQQQEQEQEQEVVRVRVQKCGGFLPPEVRSFAVDPRITPLDVLQHILLRAFDLRGQRFHLRYRGRDRRGQGAYLPLLCDGDLRTAFAAASRPSLRLRVELGRLLGAPGADLLLLPEEEEEPRAPLPAGALPFAQALLAQVGRTLSKVQQALSWRPGKEARACQPPLSAAEFHSSYLSRDGQLARPEQLRLRVYRGGVEPGLRQEVWQHLLDVLPGRLTARQRAAYLDGKSREYERLKGEWAQRAGPAALDALRGAVLRDVRRRTDHRAHRYYAGPEDGPHLRALRDLLTTYAVTHPRVAYRRGMSDLASPLLAALDHEGHAFLCFCGLLRRLSPNFHPDGGALALKFAHLRRLLRRVDPDFYRYLREAGGGAHRLLFCYRWLLLELKREFAFDDALRMLEVSWSSLPPENAPGQEVELVGSPCPGAGTGFWSCEEQPRRQRPAGGGGLAPEDAVDHAARGGQEPGGGAQPPGPAGLGDLQHLRGDPRPRKDPLAQLLHPTVLISSKSLSRPLLTSTDALLFSSSRPGSPPSSREASPAGDVAAGALRVPGVGSPQDAGKSLPPPQELGQGNPFMLFLCLAILLEHRGPIMRNGLDCHEVAMHFDRLVGKHPLGRVLHRAKALFADYLQSHV